MNCSIIDCNQIYYSKDMCHLHYGRSYHNRKIDAPKYARKGKHKMSYTRTYKSYTAMKTRCLNKNVNSYKNYGGRGITICDRWLGVDGFSNFLKDMGERPNDTSIDRIDNEGNYTPENCQWSTRLDQAQNTRRSNPSRLDPQASFNDLVSFGVPVETALYNIL